MAKQRSLENLIVPALALVEFSSIAAGIESCRCDGQEGPDQAHPSGTVQPGKYLVLIGGEVADVEESLAAGKLVGGGNVVDIVYLPQVHLEVVRALAGGRVPDREDALGVIETTTVAAAIHAGRCRRQGRARPAA